MESFFESIAWMMEPWKAYGPQHLAFILIAMPLGWLIAGKLRKNEWILFGIGLFLMITEIMKHLFFYYVINPGVFSWSIFSFQFCSVPMYLLVLLPFVNEKWKNRFYDYLLSYNLMGAFVAFFEPSGLINEYVFLTVHSFVWHYLIVFSGFYIGLRIRKAELKNFKNSFILFMILAAIAFIINLAFFRVSEGTINMFFLGPANTTIIVFKDIAERFGWYVNLPIWLACVTGGAWIFFFIWTRIPANQSLNMQE